MPLDFKIRMQPSLHQYAGTAKLHCFLDLLVDRIEIEDVAFLCQLALEWTIESAEGAVLSAEVRVVDIAIDNVGDDAFWMESAANLVGFHADADQVVRFEHLQRLCFGKGHKLSSILP